MKTFYISIKFNVVFHFNMLQQLHLPVNSIICKMRKYQEAKIMDSWLKDTNILCSYSRGY